MNGSLRLPVNLATRPLRNRRLFRTVAGFLIVLFLLLSGAAGAFLLRSDARRRADDRTAADLDLRISAAGKERGEKTGQSVAMEKRDSVFIAEINGVIARKNFSWVDLFVRLEKALPPNCVIASLNPLQLSGTSLPVTMKVLTPGLPALLALIQNLTDAKFANVTIRNELTGGGRLIGEIGFVYDGIY